MAMAEEGGVSKEEIEKVMIAELPRLMAESPAFRQQLIGIVAEAFVRKGELKQVLDAIRDLREDFNTRFEEHSRILEGYSKRLEELSKRQEEHSRILEEHSKRLEGHSQTIEELMKRLDEHAKRLESAIGGLGARWGIMSEESFRQGLKGILQDLGLKVERYLDYDPEGYVFGHPEQVELDVLIKNKTVLLVEIKSSISKEEMHTFQRKVEFYEKKQKIRVERKGVVSPFVDPRAKPVAERFGIEVYTSGYDVRI
ncbi:MAG: DUF3782 domain-containing protein [Proteobacteria bacterium]|nr:DUF3782 domain-containing protein [Pseudomonadota bacterium]